MERPAAGPRTGPMRGVRVLDMAIMLTGPYAAALLADQGAEVVKVERPGIGDLTRWIGARVNGMTSLYLVCNRGKRSVVVDATDPEGAAIIRQLAADVDVVIQNFRPGVVERLGLGYDDIRAVNPDVIYASLKAALHRFTQGVAAELLDSNIAVNCVGPSTAVRTPGAAQLIPDMFPTEPVEYLAETVLAMCHRPAAERTGLVAFSLHYPWTMQLPVHSLDGATVLPPLEPPATANPNIEPAGT